MKRLVVLRMNQSMVRGMILGFEILMMIQNPVFVAAMGKNRSIIAEPKKAQANYQAEPESTRACRWRQARREARKKGMYLKKTHKILKDFIYMVPAVPFHATYFLRPDVFEINLAFDWGNKAFNSCGSRRDASTLAFGDKRIFLKDIFLVSKLLLKNQVGIDAENSDNTSVGSIARVYKILGNQQLCFDGSFNSQLAQFNYAHHFVDGEVTVGIQVPLLRKEHRLRLCFARNDQIQQQLVDLKNSIDDHGNEAYAAFFTLYPRGIEDFFAEILDKKRLKFNRSNTDAGIGDITLFFNSEMYSCAWDHGMFGGTVVIPSASKRDADIIWDPDLGNGGFVEISAFSLMQWSPARAWNPRLFVKGTYSFHASVDRRIPEFKRFNGTNPGKTTTPLFPRATGFLLIGDDVYLNKTTFCEPDATVREFADASYRIRLRPGPEINVQFGNIIEHIFCKRDFIDVYYDFRAKGSDHVGFRRCDDDLFRGLITQNSYQVAHKIGAVYSYQADDTIRFMVGGSYIFAGRNTFERSEVGIGLRLEF